MTGKRVGFVSLGCPKALVDSERIITSLRQDGYEISPSYEAADVVVVNTCGFIDSAKAESLDAIGEAIDENGKVIVTGCLGAKESEIMEQFPNVLSISGPQQFEQVISAVHEHAPQSETYDPYIDLLPPQGIKLTPPHYAYLKISEGCNHKCSFCIIPSMRGKLRSRGIDDILNEVEVLLESGVKELLVISQDTSAYGSDIRYKSAEWRNQHYMSNLHDLCNSLGELGVWVRLHYVYPYPHVDDIIPLMAESKILPYLDIPFQHGSPSVLKRMKRPASAENNLERVLQWRSQCPELAIRSTFIVGFPGETESEFEELIDFIREAKLDRVGCFKYSAVEGASANLLPGAVDEDVKQERYEALMQAQSDISLAKQKEKIGSIQDVIIDHVEDDKITGRSKSDAPEIDGLVYLGNTEYDISAGDVVRVRISDADTYDLYAEIVDDVVY